MNIKLSHRQRAFTMIEMLVLMVVIGILAVLFLPVNYGSIRKTAKINCVNNLKQIGIAERIWEGDHNDRYSMNVPVSLGEAKELIASGNVVAGFKVISNELATTKILVCPAIKHGDYAADFKSLQRTDISYFIALDAAETNEQAILSGDDSLVVNARPVSPGILNLRTNTITWSRARHDGTGNFLLGDGSVQATGDNNLKIYIENATNNMVAIP